jgi:hypothetical protein
MDRASSSRLKGRLFDVKQTSNESCAWWCSWSWLGPCNCDLQHDFAFSSPGWRGISPVFSLSLFFTYIYNYNIIIYCWLVGSQPKFKAREVLVQQIAKGKQGLFLEDVASWVATRCLPILEWKKGNGNEICQGLWPNDVKTLCPYVLSTCDASNERVAWSAIDIYI